MPADWQTNAPLLINTPGYAPNNAASSAYEGISLAPKINQSNLQYLAGGIPNYGALTQTESGNIMNLLNPTDFTGTQREAAERAVAGGFQGSGLADQLGFNLTEEEKIRREQIGSNMLTGAASRLPAPFNPASLITRGRTATGGAEGPGITYRGGPAPGGSGGAPPPGALTPGGPPPPVVMPGTASPQNWLAEILNRYSPMPSTAGPGSAPWNMASGLGQGFATGAPGDQPGAPTDEFGMPIGAWEDVANGTPAPSGEDYGGYTGDYGGGL